MNKSPTPQDIFDIRKIRRLVELMKEHDLSEIDLQQGDLRIQLRQSSAGLSGAGMVPTPGAAAPLPAANPPERLHALPPPVEESSLVLIKSPMVGTFYTAPDPESPAFIKVGDHVGPETTVCIVEAMKVFNQIPAEISGKIVAVLVENGQSVEFGQPLFRVDPRG
jgi:acetyl-CoA carboxylase biotin carboxyl carrier protein